MKEKENKLKTMITMMQESGHMEMLIGALFHKKLDGDKLKYNEAELENLEDSINDMFPEGHRPQPTTLIPFGFYLGELIKKKIPGSEWKFPVDGDDMNIWDLAIEYTTTDGMIMHAKPFMRAEKFWKNRNDKMSSFIRMICFNTEIVMDKEYWSKRTDGKGWITMAWGDMYRMFIGNKDDEDFSKAKGAFHDGTFGDGK